MTVNSFENVLKLLRKTKQQLSDILYAFEVMDDTSMQLVMSEDANAVYPFSKPYPFYVIIETGSTE